MARCYLIPRVLFALANAISSMGSVATFLMRYPFKLRKEHGPSFGAGFKLSEVVKGVLSSAGGILAMDVSSLLGGDGYYMHRFVCLTYTLLPSVSSIESSSNSPGPG